MNQHQAFLPAAQVRLRYGVSHMSLWRWLNNKATGFPKPIRINGRRFWKLAELEQWEDESRAAANNESSEAA